MKNFLKLTGYIFCFFKTSIFLIHMGLTSKRRIRETMQEFNKQILKNKGSVTAIQ